MSACVLAGSNTTLVNYTNSESSLHNSFNAGTLKTTVENPLQQLSAFLTA